MHFQGWTDDPDYLGRPSLVVLYVDGQPAATKRTIGYPQPRPAGTGYYSKFDILVPTSVATHVGCIWVVNVGLGDNKFLGCRAVDNRNPSLNAVAFTPAPALNARVLAEAKKHIGQPYVWGAAGPTRFDCSGLVMYSYGTQHFATPRVSQDQIKAARLIPASHARPGDLVFQHDRVGDVYHVAIFVQPGLTVAAIDEQSGVNYQKIWDPTVTYGSFTHT